MKLGTFMMPLHPPGRSPAQTYAEDREAILLADRLGYCEAYVGEHVTDLAENVTSCLMFLASVAHDTRNIVLGSGTINMPNGHPAAIAAQVAMLDHMLKGRFIMGISPGGLMSDAEVFGNFGKDRNAIFLESINMVLDIWKGEGPYDLKGNFFEVTTGKTMIPEIGQGTILREYVTIHRGTVPESETVVGEGCFLLAGSHVGHNCRLGNYVTLINNALLAGYVEVGERATVSGGAGVHQFARIGELAMVSGNARVSMDIVPFALVDGDGRIVGLNRVGLRRANVPREDVADIRAAFRTLFGSKLPFREVIERVTREVRTLCGRRLVQFLQATSQRGIAGGSRRRLSSSTTRDEESAGG